MGHLSPAVRVAPRLPGPHSFGTLPAPAALPANGPSTPRPGELRGAASRLRCAGLALSLAVTHARKQYVYGRGMMGAVSRTPEKPPPRYSLSDASQAAGQIRHLRFEALDPDLDGFPPEVVDDLDVAAVVTYTERHRRVGLAVRAAELPHRALLVEYQRQRDADRHERALLAVLTAGHQLGVHPESYGSPMGLNTRQAVFNRRSRLLRKRGTAVERSLGHEGRAREWMTEHARQLRALVDVLTDNREEVLGLVDGVAGRRELSRQLDIIGAHPSPRPTQELCAALAIAMLTLKPGAARASADSEIEAQLEHGRRLLL
jgi:hypothetical protein